MTDRFDLEQAIMKAWQTCDDIDLILDAYDSMDEDQRMNALIGLSQMNNLRLNKIWDVFEACVATGFDRD